MPSRPPHPCNRTGCKNLTRDRFCSPECWSWSDSQRGNANQRGYGPAHRAMRERVFAEEPNCRQCNEPGTKGDHADHIVAKRDGGSNERSNYQRLCGTCHRRKDARATRW